MMNKLAGSFFAICINSMGLLGCPGENSVWLGYWAIETETGDVRGLLFFLPDGRVSVDGDFCQYEAPAPNELIIQCNNLKEVCSIGYAADERRTMLCEKDPNDPYPGDRKKIWLRPISSDEAKGLLDELHR
ncbi:MAG TPA: hypothetical protein DEA96_09815 [Leptospiraceae bacterium]|nr:hypothetical protein [Leptospiraceae bacterium]|tara:strand:- start:27 stop:419 length:393 start_codon:yes stop_codon:yes gene_type:complete